MTIIGDLLPVPGDYRSQPSLSIYPQRLLARKERRTLKGIARDMERGRGSRTRTIYLVGNKRGYCRLSRSARKRQRGRDSQARKGGRKDGEYVAVERLVSILQRENLGEEQLLSDRIFRLGRGYREGREDRTFYAMDKEGDSMWGRSIGLEEEEVRSGRRWFRIGYPCCWEQELSVEACEVKASRSQEEYGKEFVEHGGKWYEVEAEVVL